MAERPSIRFRRSGRGWARGLGLLLAAGGAFARAEPEPVAASSAAALNREALRDRGRKAQEDGLYDFAERQFRESLAQAATDAERAADLLGLTSALNAGGKAAEARQLLDDWRAAHPGGENGGLELEVERSRAALLSNDPPGALMLLDAALAATPTNAPALPRLWRLRARALRAAGKDAEALAAFAQFAQRFPGDAEVPANLLDWAAARIEGGDSAGAIPILERLLREFPRHTAAEEGRLWLGRARLELGDADAAETLLRPLADNTGRPAGLRARAWLQLAAGCEARTNLTAALQAVEAGAALAATNTPLATRAALSRARLLIRLGRWEEGRTLLRAELPRAADDALAADTQLFLARWLLDHRQPAAALDEFQNHLETFTRGAGPANAWLGKGWALLALGRPTEAADAFHQAGELATAPASRREAALKEADARFAAGQYETALAAYRAFAAAHPGDEWLPQAGLQAVESLVKLGRRDEGLAALAELERQWPRQPIAEEAALRAAGLLAETADAAAARAAYTRVLTGYPGGARAAQARLGRGWVAWNAGDWAAALEDFTALAAGEGPEAETAHYLRGLCLYRLGKEREALEVNREFLTRFPSSGRAPDVQFWLGETAFNRGDMAIAEPAFRRVADAYPRSAPAGEALYWAGRAAAAQREYLRALEHYTRLAREFPDSPLLLDARFAQGDALSELGQLGGAILAYQEIVKSQPDSLLGALAWGRLGDCHFTLAADDPRRYAEAQRCYETARSHPAAPPDLRWQADYKLGRCLEALRRPDDAVTMYLGVVYDHLREREAGRLGAPLWFSRAAFAAADVKERQGQGLAALRIYRRIAQEGGAAAQEAAERMTRLRLGQWIWTM